MSVPDWANPDLSKELPVLRSKGEGQYLEYKREFPKQTTDLAKEIAAFATSNQGIILLGVEDSGDLVGLPNMDDPAQRDTLLKRVAGICRGTVKPAITPTVEFAVEDGKAVLVVTVPKGLQSIYYCENRPIVRHLSESRPAEPHEVVELIQRWLNLSIQQEPEKSPATEYLSRLSRVLVDVAIYGDEIDSRILNPWLAMLRSHFQQAAKELRLLAVEPFTTEHGIKATIEDLSQTLEDTSSIRLTTGSSAQFMDGVRQATEKAKGIKRAHVDIGSLSSPSLEKVGNELVALNDRLRSLICRVDMVEPDRLEELKAVAAEIGMSLLRISYYPIDSIRMGLSQDLSAVGRDLHLVETVQLYLDGGRSERVLLERIKSDGESLSNIIAWFQDQPHD